MSVHTNWKRFGPLNRFSETPKTPKKRLSPERFSDIHSQAQPPAHEGAFLCEQENIRASRSRSFRVAANAILRAFLPCNKLLSHCLIAAFTPPFPRKLRHMPSRCPPPAAYRASVLHFTQPPPTGIPANFLSSPPPHEYFEDGCLLISGGKVVATGSGDRQLLTTAQAAYSDDFCRTMGLSIYGGVERKTCC